MTTSTLPTLDIPAVPPISAGGRGLRHEIRAAGVVWQRDLIRFWGDKPRIVSSLVQPLLFLFVMGTGLSSIIAHGQGGIDYKTFLFPGVIVTGILFTAVFSAISIVWDREFGFLREMLVAPISSSSIVVGKCLGGATVATGQSFILIALAGLVHVPYTASMIFGCAGVVFLVSFAMTAFGLVMASRVKTVQTLMPMMQLVLMPLMFLSGSLFPISSGLPTWLQVLTRLNPMSYGVTAMRTIVFNALPPSSATAHFPVGLSWFGWPVPAWLDVVVVLVTGVALLGGACLRFSRTD